MLALSRKKGEALMINNDIEITVLDIKGEQVKNRYQRTQGGAGIPQGSIYPDSGSKQGSLCKHGRHGAARKPVWKIICEM